MKLPKVFRGSVAWTIVAFPLVLILAFAIAVQVGLALIYEEQANVLQKQSRLSEIRAQAERVPTRIATIQQDLYRLSVLGSIGLEGPEVEKTRARIAESFEQLGRDLALTELGTESDMGRLQSLYATYKSAVDQTLVLIERSPIIGVTATRGVEPVYAEIEAAALKNAEFVTAETVNELARTRSQWRALIISSIAWTLLLMAALSGLSFLSSRLITRPILRLAKSVDQLERGDVEVDVPGIERLDELGMVARSIEQFRLNLIRTLALQAERDELNQTLEEKVRLRTAEVHEKSRLLTEAQQKAEAERLEMAQRLATEFGVVVKAAAMGDFSHRIDSTFSDHNLQSLADEINRMVQTVDASVSAAASAIRELASEGSHSAQAKNFSGAFADMLANIEETAKQIRTQSTQLRHNALHDTLTGLPNRRYLEQRLDELTDAGASSGHGIALLHIDLDRFKEVNDTIGHAAGDAVLKRSTERLEAEAGPDDFVARVGGDEFVILAPVAYDLAAKCPTPEDSERVTSIANRLVDALSKPFDFDGIEIRHGASVGIAFGHTSETDISHLMVDADIALYAAKENGRNQARLYTPDLNSNLMSHKALADEIHRALEADEFIPFFQPQVTASDCALHGIEALVRWRHPTKGLLAPGAFLAVAKDIGVLDRIDHIIAQKSVAAAERMVAAGVSFQQLSINVGLASLERPEFLEDLRTLLSPNFQLSVELLETIFFDEQTTAFQLVLDSLREMNVRIEIDDFGSGRASISGLLTISPDRIKIDRSIIQAVEHSVQQQAMVRAIVDMARALNVEVLAEGVEDARMAKLLNEMGCEMFQGYAFGKPMSEADMLRTFDQGRSPQKMAI